MNIQPISVILLVHQEADIIESVVKDFYEKIISRIPGSEFLIFEDGSTDGTKTILRAIEKKYALSLHLGDERRGYTAAMRVALSAATKEVVLFSDSDGQHNPQDFWRLYPELDTYDLVVGWKKKRHDGVIRTIVSKMYNLLIAFCFGVRLHDIDCGFRLMKKTVIAKLLAEPWRLKHCISSELTIRAAAHGFKVSEVSVEHRPRQFGESRGLPFKKLPRISIEILRGLLKVKQDLRGTSLNQKVGAQLRVWHVALVGALFVSFVYGLPYVLIKRELASEGKRYHPVTIYSDWDEAVGYAPLTKEAGRYLKQVDPALREHKNTPLLLPPSGAIVLGALSRFFGIERVWVGADFVLPPIIFLLFFGVLFILTRHTLASFFGSIIFIFTRELASLIPFSQLIHLKRFLLYFKPYISQPPDFRLQFDRLFSTEWTFIPLAAFFLFTLLALYRQPQRWRAYLLAGTTYGILFYSYFYDWVAISIILGVWWLVEYFIWRNKALSRRIILIIIFGLGVSIFYWVTFWQVSRLPQYADIVGRTGLERGRIFNWALWPHYLLWFGCASWLVWKQRNQPGISFAAAIFLGSVVIMNVQFITGFIPQPVHFLQYPLSLALFVAYCILILQLRFVVYPKPIRYWNGAVLALFVVAALLVTARAVQWQISYARNNAWRYTLPPTVDESFTWLHQKLASGSVVLSPSFITNTHLLILTPAKVFFPPTALNTSASNRELIERFIVAAKLFGASDVRIKQLFDVQYLSKVNTFGGWNQEYSAATLLHGALYHSEVDKRVEGVAFRQPYDIEVMVSEILRMWHSDPEPLLKKYAFEYVYNGPYERELFSSFSVDTFPLCLKSVFNNQDVSIYQRCSDNITAVNR